MHLAQALDHAGIDAQRAPARAGSTLGVELDGANVTSVREDGAAAGALSPGDEILALGGLRTAGAGAIGERMKSIPPGTRITVTLARDGVLRTVEVQMGSPPPGALRFVPRESCLLYTSPSPRDS